MALSRHLECRGQAKTSVYHVNKWFLANYLQRVPNIKRRNKKKLINKWHLHILLLYTINLPSNIISWHAGLLVWVAFAFISKTGTCACSNAEEWKNIFRKAPGMEIQMWCQSLSWTFLPQSSFRTCRKCFVSFQLSNQANSIFCIISPCLKFLVFFSVRCHFKTAIQTVVSHSGNFCFYYYTV